MESRFSESARLVVVVSVTVILTVALLAGTSATSQPVPSAPNDERLCPYSSVPPVDPPKSIRQANYAGGSCMHASLITLLRWQGRGKAADHWRQTHRGAEDVPGLASIARRLNLPYAYTSSGDVGFLEWASATRRGAAIHYFTRHAVTFLGFHNGDAVLLDNNRTSRYVRISKTQFLENWRGYGGYAITTVYPPPTPKPW